MSPSEHPQDRSVLLQEARYSVIQRSQLPSELLAGLRGGLIDVVGAGLADRREDFLEDPIAELLGLRGIASGEHLVGVGLGEYPSVPPAVAVRQFHRGIQSGVRCHFEVTPFEITFRAFLVLNEALRVLQASRSGNLGSDEQEVMLGVADQNVQLSGTQ